MVNNRVILDNFIHSLSNVTILYLVSSVICVRANMVTLSFDVREICMDNDTFFMKFLMVFCNFPHNKVQEIDYPCKNKVTNHVVSISEN